MYAQYATFHFFQTLFENQTKKHYFYFDFDTKNQVFKNKLNQNT